MLADDSHEISYLIFFRKFEKMLKNLSSAAVVIGALRVNSVHCYLIHSSRMEFPTRINWTSPFPF